MAEKIHQRIDQIKAVDAVETMIKHRIGRCHSLLGKREGQYAVDLIHPQRLIFTVRGETVQVAKIEEIVDYH